MVFLMVWAFLKIENVNKCGAYKALCESGPGTIGYFQTVSNRLKTRMLTRHCRILLS